MDAQRIESLFQCVFCKGIPKSSKVLPCLHSCCLSCIAALSTRGNGFHCAICHEEVHRSAFTSLPDNILLNALQETLEIQEASKGNQTCKLCGQNIHNTKRFPDCAEAFCEPCLQLHKEKIKSDDKENFMENRKQLKELKLRHCCKQHEDEGLRYICITCEEPICSECLIMAHRHHQLAKIEEYCNSYRTQVALAEMQINEKMVPFEKGLVLLDTMKKNISSNAENGKRNIQKCINKYKEKLDDIEEQMIAEVELEAKRKCFLLEEQATELLEIVEKLEVARQFASSTLKHASDVEITMIKKHITKRTDYLQTLDVKEKPGNCRQIISEEELTRSLKSMILTEFK